MEGMFHMEKRKLSLPAWIFIGMAAGIVVGLINIALAKANPDSAFLATFCTDWLKPIGTIYINLLKFLVVPVVLFSIADGVVSLKDLKRVGSVGLRTFVYYMCTTALAVVIGLILANIALGLNLFPTLETSGLAYEAKESPSVMQVIVNIFPDNLFKPMVNADMLPVIVIAVLLGAGILAAGDEGVARDAEVVLGVRDVFRVGGRRHGDDLLARTDLARRPADRQPDVELAGVRGEDLVEIRAVHARDLRTGPVGQLDVEEAVVVKPHRDAAPPEHGLFFRRPGVQPELDRLVLVAGDRRSVGIRQRSLIGERDRLRPGDDRRHRHHRHHHQSFHLSFLSACMLVLKS